MASALTNPSLSSNFFGTQIFISAPTPKTVPRKFILPQSILNKKNSDKLFNISNHAALAALLFSSITPQAFALDTTTPPPPPTSAPQVIEVEAQKPGPFAQNLILNAPNSKPQAQSSSELPDGPQWRYSEFLNAVKKGKVERVRFNKDGGVLQLTAVDGRRATVIVPNDPDLIDILAMNGVDISVSEGDSGNGFSVLSGISCFQLLLLQGFSFSSDGPKAGREGPVDSAGRWTSAGPSPSSRRFQKPA